MLLRYLILALTFPYLPATLAIISTAFNDFSARYRALAIYDALALLSLSTAYFMSYPDPYMAVHSPSLSAI